MKIKKILKSLKNKKILNKERLIVLAVLFLAASLRMAFEFFPGSADATWYDSDWKYRQKVTITNSMVASTETSFPMLVKSTQNALKSIWSGGRVGKVNGGDILFTAADGTTKLYHEVESYSFSSGELIAWVKVPSITTTGDQFIYMYYGNEYCADQWDLTGSVWSDRYVAVYHMGDNCSTSGCYKDSVKGNNATPYSGDLISNLNDNLGKIGKAVAFDGDNDYLKIPDSLDLDVGETLTVEAYSQLNELNRYSALFDKGSYNAKVGPDKSYLFTARTDFSTSEFSSVESFGENYVLTSLAEYNGELFVTIEGVVDSASKIYSSNNGTDFSVAGTFNIGDKIGGLTVFKDDLYAFVGNKVYVSETGYSWSTAYTASDVISSMLVFENYLYIATETNGKIMRSLTGSSWSLAKDFDNADLTNIVAMTVFDGKIFAGGDTGKIFMSGDGTNYASDEEFSSGSVVTAMGVFDGKLFVGVNTSGVGNTYYRDFSGNYSASNF